MRLNAQITEIQLKQLSLVTLIVGGLCVQAFAQSPTSSSPALPPLPSLPGTASTSLPAPPAINLPSLAPQPTLAALPPISTAPSPTPAPAAPDANAGKLPELTLDSGVTAQVPAPASPEEEIAPPSPEAAEVAAAEKAAGLDNATTSDAGGTLPPQGLPELPLPGAVGTASLNTAVPSIELPAIALPEVQVNQEIAPPKPKVKTWLTKLAPSIIPPKTNFNYKRIVLPDVIYRDAYTYDNQHLPLRVTRDDYERLLFAAVAKNDIEATRALLNAGTGLQATNASGETPLALAKRLGALDVAALLAARGAR